MRLALTEKVAVLTGGPGCGKSFTVRSIVALAKAKRAKIVLAVPTGRAAKRLSELASVEASTLHLCRLLAASGLSGRATCRGCIANLHHLGVVAPHADGPANGPPIRSLCASPMGDEVA